MPTTTKLKAKAVPTEPEVDPNLSIEEVSTEEIASYLATSEQIEPQPQQIELEQIEPVQPQPTQAIPQVATVVQKESTGEKQQVLDDAKTFLNQFISFISSHQYDDELNRLAIKYNIPKKRLSQSFLARMFGVISDVFGVVIETARYTLKTIIGFISYVLHTGTDLICNLALGLGRILTLNQGA